MQNTNQKNRKTEIKKIDFIVKAKYSFLKYNVFICSIYNALKYAISKKPQIDERLSSNEITSTPNDNVAITVAGKNVTVLIEGDTSDISGLVPALEDTHTFVKHTTIVQGPKGYVSFPARNDLVPFQRMPLGANHRVDGTL